jgi:hypothetical protein
MQKIALCFTITFFTKQRGKSSINSRYISPPLGWSLLVAVIGLLIAIKPVEALPISTSFDVNTLRTSIFSDEGYLSYHLFSPFGEERTGWTDVRHPSKAGSEDKKKGYDRSDHFLNVRTSKLLDQNGILAPDDRITDFDFANKAFAQAGLGVIESSHRPKVVSEAPGQPGYFTFPLSSQPFNTNEERSIMETFNLGVSAVDVYYAESLDSNALGETWYPSYDPSGANNEGIFMSNVGRGFPDTFAHELFHFVADGEAVHQPVPNDKAHSKDPTNLIAQGTNVWPQWDPGMKKDTFGPNKPPWDIANSLDVVGRPISTNPNGSPKVGGIDQIEINQIQRIFEPVATNKASPYITTVDNGFTYGDRADFDWVEDNRFLEPIPGADNHVAVDWMVWGIGPTLSSSHTGHDHGSWGELNLPSFTGSSFRVVDVVSQIARYADMDVDTAGNWSRRESALDYYLQFSFDGTSWVDGTVNKVFIPGWTNASSADDYVARWISPIEARFGRVSGSLVLGHDGNVQIDAIIASAVPEPSTFLLIGSGLAGIIGFGRKKLFRKA